MNLKKTLSIFFFYFSLFILSVSFSSAQSQLSITTNQDNIEPHQTVTVFLTTYSFDIDTTFVEWYIGGKLYTSGLGLSSIPITTGPIGTSIPLSAKVTTPTGETLEVQVNLSPQSVDLVWEVPESYTPPFYEGKALPGEGALIHLTALPNMSENGIQIAPERIAYAWFVNGESVLNASGINKQTAKIPLETFTKKTEVKVRARTSSGKIAEKTITIVPSEIQPVLYTYDPILGIDRSLSLFRRFETSKEITFALVPYFFSTKGQSLSSAANYTWLLDGLPITPEGNLLSLKPKEESYGVKSLSIYLDNAKRFLQKGSLDIEIIFDSRSK